MSVFKEYFSEVCSPKISSTEQEPLEIRISLTYFEELIALNIENKSLILCYPVQCLVSWMLDCHLIRCIRLNKYLVITIPASFWQFDHLEFHQFVGLFVQAMS